MHRRAPAAVAVALSGGVDSSVAGHLTKAAYAGCDTRVVGVHMSNWDHANESGSGRTCTAEREADEARKVAEYLGLPFHHVSFKAEYWNDVFAPALQGYSVGTTPNPDVACNVHIKFGSLLKYVQEELGASVLVTGHYAKVTNTEFDGDSSGGGARVGRLWAAADSTKDQSYFLCGVSGAALACAAFPLGNLRKSEVRVLARQVGLHTWNRKDSTGICFVGKRKFGDFIGEYIAPRRGKFVCAESGRELGEHDGAFKFTVGQRARIAGLSERWYVVSKGDGSGDVTVCAGEDHPLLFTTRATVSQVRWVAGVPPPPSSLEKVSVRIRHLGELHSVARIAFKSPSSVEVEWSAPVRGVARGQVAAFYDSVTHECYGGGQLG